MDVAIPEGRVDDPDERTTANRDALVAGHPLRGGREPLNRDRVQECRLKGGWTRLAD